MSNGKSLGCKDHVESEGLRKTAQRSKTNKFLHTIKEVQCSGDPRWGPGFLLLSVKSLPPDVKYIYI